MDDDEDHGFTVVYGDAGQASPKAAQGPIARSRYALPQAASAAQPSSPGSPTAAAGAGGGAVSPTISGGRADNRNASLAGGTSAGDEVQLTLAQDLQTLINDLTQQPPKQDGLGQGAAEQEQHQQGSETGTGRRHRPGVVRQIKHISPEDPPPSQLPPHLAASGQGAHSGGRRWRRPQRQPTPERAAQQRQSGRGTGSVTVPAAAAEAAGAGAGGANHDSGGTHSSFFSVDADLVQAHAQREALHSGPGHGRQHQAQNRRPQQRAVQWDSPQAAPSAAEHTPQPAQRANPLAALLGSGNTIGGTSAASKQRQPATASRLRGRHPIYGAPTPAASSPAPGAGSDAGSRLHELGLREAPLTSPHLPPAQRRQPQPQHQHSRFARQEAGAEGAPDSSGRPLQAALGGGEGGQTASMGIRLLTGSEPTSALRQQQFQPRPRRPRSPKEVIEEEQAQQAQQAQQASGLDPGQAWQQQQHQHQHQQQEQQQQQPWEQPAQGNAAEGATGDHFRTPGQPLRRAMRDELEQGFGYSAGGGSHTGGMGATPAAAAVTPGSAGGTGLSLQRSFIAQLQPVSRPAAAATMQQQRQRLAGVVGLHARMQAILAAERAGLAQSPVGGVLAGPRLTVLQKELETGITKCHCRCDGAAAAALGCPEVIALLQNRMARELDTTPGSVILLREPWRVIPVEGLQWPVVLCYGVAPG